MTLRRVVVAAMLALAWILNDRDYCEDGTVVVIGKVPVCVED